VGERGWQPLDLDIRISSEASLRLEGEGVALQAQARREREGATLDLSGRAVLVLRFLSPPAAAADVSGDVSEVRQNRVDGRLAIELRLDGSARVRAR
jgi:hypothetical protein